MILPTNQIGQFAAGNAQSALLGAGAASLAGAGSFGFLGPLAGVAQIAGGILGNRAQKKAQTKQKRELIKNQILQNEALRRGTQQGMGFLKRAEGDVRQGYADAKAQSGLATYGAKQDLLSREVAQKSEAKQSAVSRGLYNTSAYDAVSRGITSDTSRTLANIDSTLANVYAQLSQAQGRDLADINTQRATLATNNANAQLGILGQAYNQTASQQFISQAPDFAGLLGLLAGQNAVNKFAKTGFFGK